jgi:hypothetical protein
VATAVGAYEVEIFTGPRIEEGERVARLNLFSEQGGDFLGRIYFYGPQVTLESDFVDRGSNPVLHLHMGNALKRVGSPKQREAGVYRVRTK